VFVGKKDRYQVQRNLLYLLKCFVISAFDRLFAALGRSSLSAHLQHLLICPPKASKMLCNELNLLEIESVLKDE
jgi:hypothetical protein